MATTAALRATLPAFAGVDEMVLQRYLDMAARGADLSAFGDSADDAHIFLAAHLMSLAGIGPGAQAGQLAGFTSVKAGSLSLTRSEQAAAGEYAASNYGILFWRLQTRFASTSGGIGFAVTGTGQAYQSPGPFLYAPPHGQE